MNVASDKFLVVKAMIAEWEKPCSERLDPCEDMEPEEVERRFLAELKELLAVYDRAAERQASGLMDPVWGEKRPVGWPD